MENWTWVEIFEFFMWCANDLVLGLLSLQAVFYFAQLVVAAEELGRHRRRAQSADSWWLLTSEITFPISILVPAYNEEASIVDSIRSLLSLHYPDFEIVVINDGSKDNTMQAILNAYELKPIERVHELAVPHKKIRGIYGNPNFARLLLIDKENGGKSDALNAGINLARFPLVCAVDADSILEPDALLRVVRPFIERPETMIAAGGRIRVVNGCTVHGGTVVARGLPRNPVALFQVVEYIRAFLLARLAWSRLQALLIISGAFGVFKRSSLLLVGGYSHNTVGEDMEIVAKLHRYYRDNKILYEMRYVPDPVCWTEAPQSLKILGRQRSRWQRGMLETLYKHRSMIFNLRYGPVATIGMGLFFIFDVVGPMIEFGGYFLTPACWVAGFLSGEFFMAFLMLTFIYGIFLSVGSLLLQEIALPRAVNPLELIWLTIGAILENFGYRQINSFWRWQGFWQFLRRKKSWGTMTRTGFQKR